MERLISLLKERNSCLRKFYTLNKAELLRLNEGNFGRLTAFYQSREGVLELIAHVDLLIEEAMDQVGSNKIASEEHKTLIRGHLNFKDELAKEIMNQDLIILDIIDREKSRIITELTEVSRAKQVVSAYNPKDPRPHLDEKY